MDDTTRDEHPRTPRMPKNDRVLVIAPIGQDAAAMATLLDGQGFETQICHGLDGYSRQMIDSAGALLLTEEALESPQGSLLLDLLKGQSPWSELPLIILTSGGESRRAGLLNLAAAAAGSVTLLERPISTLTLMRSVEVALRSRRRQYQVRDLVSQLANLNQTLEQRVAKRTAEAVEQAQKLRLLSAELSAQREPIAREIADALERAFQLTRTLSVELAPPVLYEHGLAAALEWLAAETRKNYKVEVTVEADSSANPKVADVRIFLFRAVRELLLNSVKHAVGSAVCITMQHLRPDKVRIIVADGGPGFDPTSLDDTQTGAQTFGLLNIRDRVRSFGGKFDINSGPKRGTKITLWLPRGSTAQVKSADGAKRSRRRRTLATGSLKRDQITAMAIRASG